ncbi:MAG: tRNA 4-thiouridine(8) synthase ThiI [Clostridiaceae bacterium]
MTRALALLSGGLDSILAAKLIKKQGIDVIGICFKSYFFAERNAERMAAQIGIPLKIIDISEDHLKMIENPKHGYGKNMNPCIDCHAMMLRLSGGLLDEMDADFIITGEVLNQRPMSQRRDALDIVRNESLYKDKILRPLCAKMLPPTKMEEEGLVDRERLLGISGRSRKEQMALAETWDIKDYPSPAGGCALTEPNYASRLRELLSHDKNPSEKDIFLLKIGRHFRVSDGAKIVSTRDAKEAEIMKNLLDENDLVFQAKDYNGSMVAIIGKATREDIEFAGKATARYSKGKDMDSIIIRYGFYKKSYDQRLEAKKTSDEELQKYII